MVARLLGAALSLFLPLPLRFRMEKSVELSEKGLLPLPNPTPPPRKRLSASRIATAGLVLAVFGFSLLHRPHPQHSNSVDAAQRHSRFVDRRAVGAYAAAFHHQHFLSAESEVPAAAVEAAWPKPRLPHFPEHIPCHHKKPITNKEAEAILLSVPDAESARNASHSCVLCPASIYAARISP